MNKEIQEMFKKDGLDAYKYSASKLALKDTSVLEASTKPSIDDLGVIEIE